MTFNRYMQVGLLLLVGMTHSAFSLPKNPLAVNGTYLSPDGRYQAKLKKPPAPPPESTAPKPTGFLLEIKDLQNEKESKTLEIKALPYALAWTRDSKNIITVEQNEKSASTGIFRLEKNVWKHFFVEQPGDDFQSFDVVQQVVGRTNLKLVYKATSQAPNEPVAYHTYTFTFDPESNVISEILKKSLTKDAYFELKNLCGK